MYQAENNASHRPSGAGDENGEDDQEITDDYDDEYAAEGAQFLLVSRISSYTFPPLFELRH